MTKRKAAETVAKDEQPQQKKVRRMKVLTPKKIPKSQKQLYEANATNSPLLRLPAEVRNRIWYLVLCGKTIHIRKVTPRGQGFEHAVCSAVINDKEAATMIGVRNGESADEASTSYNTRHYECIPKRLLDSQAAMNDCALSVLAACRQIHQEAALLPYKGNTFTFSSPYAIAPFLKALVPAQAHAIERIVIRCEHGYHNVTLEKLLCSKFKGLKDIVCMFEPWVDVQDGGDFATLEMEGLRSSTNLATTLLQFRHSPIVTATVSVLGWGYSSDGSEVLGRTYGMARQWAKDLEEQLMTAA